MLLRHESVIFKSFLLSTSGVLISNSLDIEQTKRKPHASWFQLIQTLPEYWEVIISISKAVEGRFLENQQVYPLQAIAFLSGGFISRISLPRWPHWTGELRTHTLCPPHTLKAFSSVQPTPFILFLEWMNEEKQ